MQMTQVQAGIAKGALAVNNEIEEHNTSSLKSPNPAYQPLSRQEVESLRDDLHEDAMGLGGIVSDGRRWKMRESMLNFLYVQGISGTCLYCSAVDMALSPSKLLKQVEREFDTSGMEPSAVLNLGDVVSILDSVKQRIRAFQQRCCVVDPLTASPLDVTSHLSAMFCGMRSDVV
ncbi:unnamed protein product, partial [Prorocentrum cordatum]